MDSSTSPCFNMNNVTVRMKKLIFILLLFIPLLLNSMAAQNNKFVAETFIGINGGASGSMVLFKPLVVQEYLLVYHGGLVFRHISENHFGVQLELNYVQKGWQEINQTYGKRLDYIELPFMTHLYFGNKTQVYLNIGPKVGYLIQEQTLFNENLSSKAAQHAAIENKFDYGFVGSLGLLFKIKQQVFQLESRANFSVSNIFSNEKKDYFDNSNHLNVGLSLAWLFKIQ